MQRRPFKWWICWGQIRLLLHGVLSNGSAWHTTPSCGQSVNWRNKVSSRKSVVGNAIESTARGSCYRFSKSRPNSNQQQSFEQRASLHFPILLSEADFSPLI